MSDQPLRPAALREEVHARLVEELVCGRLPPGEVLRDEALARRLGVSRTPVREAMVRLADRGLVVSHHLRGFRVAPLDADEVRELYPVTWALEAEALRSTRRLPPVALERLRAGVDRLREERSPRRRCELDRKWHDTLVSGCPNQRLVRLLDEQRDLILRYELAYMASEADVSRSVEEHLELLDLVAEQRWSSAASRVTKHWRQGMRAVLEKITSEDSHGR